MNTMSAGPTDSPTGPHPEGVARLLVIATGIAAAVALSIARPASVLGQLPSVSGPIQHARGQNVAPVYEGWYRGRDGTINVSFGYLNKNYEEAVDIPIGPGNRIEPGPVDRGQPTHFLPRRHWGVFVVTLPKDHPKTAEVTWTLTVRGRTETVPANLSELYLVDALEHVGGTDEGTTPPVLKLDPAGASALGPAGLSKTLNATVGRPLPLQVWVADEHRGQNAKSGEAPPRQQSPFSVIWSVYRGPAAVRFGDPRPPVADGTAKTDATFSEPGDYTLRVAALRGTRFSGQCCWTNGYVSVKVGAGTTRP